MTVLMLVVSDRFRRRGEGHGAIVAFLVVRGSAVVVSKHCPQIFSDQNLFALHLTERTRQKIIHFIPTRIRLGFALTVADLAVAYYDRRLAVR
jgi:hypothetical protein